MATASFWALAAFIALLFLTAGGARGDIQSLIVVRPLAVVLCGWAIGTSTLGQLRGYRFLLLVAALMFAVVVANLLPLPPSVWSALPGRDIVEEVDRVARLGNQWRPMTLDPDASWNALFSLFVPLAVLLLATRLSADEHRRLLTVIVFCGALSGLLGALQLMGPSDGPLYLYRITNEGSAVGLFANRNHQAMFLATLLPILAVFAATSDEGRWGQLERTGALLLGLFLLPLILITGSRVGLLLAAAGIFCVPYLYRARSRGRRTRSRGLPGRTLYWYVAAGVGIVLLAGATIVLSRAEAVQRLLAIGADEELRFKVWPEIWKAAWSYFPFGSGAGAFVKPFLLVEPDALLRLTYLNHAHNDYLEVLMTTGLVGVAIVVVAAAGFIRAGYALLSAKRASDPNELMAQCGAIVILMLAIGSFGDYPLRVPSLTALFVLAAVWLTNGWNRRKKAGTASRDILSGRAGFEESLS